MFLFSFEQQVDLILKQLVYSLLNSMQDSWFALRPCQPFYDKNTTCRLIRSFILITCLLGQLLILSEGSFWLLWKFEKIKTKKKRMKEKGTEKLNLRLSLYFKMKCTHLAILPPTIRLYKGHALQIFTFSYRHTIGLHAMSNFSSNPS